MQLIEKNQMMLPKIGDFYCCGSTVWQLVFTLLRAEISINVVSVILTLCSHTLVRLQVSHKIFSLLEIR